MKTLCHHFCSSEDEDDLPHPRERVHVNSHGFNDFCVKNHNYHQFGRREIELAEQASERESSS